MEGSTTKLRPKQEILTFPFRRFAALHPKILSRPNRISSTLSDPRPRLAPRTTLGSNTRQEQVFTAQATGVHSISISAHQCRLSPLHTHQTSCDTHPHSLHTTSHTVSGMDTLAADLQEATSELLELPGQQRSASQRSQAQISSATQLSGGWSSKSRLVILDSNGEPQARRKLSAKSDLARIKVRTPSPTLNLEAEQGSNSGDEQHNEPIQASTITLKAPDDRLGSLSSRTPPLPPSSAFRAEQRVLVASQDKPSEASASSMQSKTDIATLGKMASKGDVWLNERGERVIDGQIVGKLSLAGHNQQQQDHLLARDSEAAEKTTTQDDTLPRQAVGFHRAYGNHFDHTAHGASQRLHTPDFFLRSFPSAEEKTRSTDITPRPSIDNANDADSADVWAEAHGSPDSKPPTERKASSILSVGSSSLCSPQLAEITSDTVKLHGNRKAAVMAGDDLPAQPSVKHAQHSTGQNRSGGIAWQTHRRSASGGRPRASPRSSSFKDRPLLDRASSLFSTPLVPPRAEREVDADADDDGGAWEDEQHEVEELSSPLSPVVDDDGGSLLSLPASSVTGSNSDRASASRRSTSLRRGNSTGSATSSHRHSGGDVYARDVRVRGWSEVGTRTRGGYVSFEIVVLTKKGVVIHAHRRYSSFAQLRRQLAEQVPQHKSALPTLPPKDALHKYSAKHLEQRRLALTEWLQAVMLDARWGSRTREWLVGTG